MPQQQAKHNTEIEISSRRVVLRPMREADIAAVEPWYPDEVGAVHGVLDEPGSVQNLHHHLEAARADPDAGLLVITCRDDPSASSPSGASESAERTGQAPAPIGLLDYRASDPAPGWLTIGFIAVAQTHRSLGYDSEAVRLLEAAASERHQANRFRAGVPASNGLGFYFWLRLGYRPARADERFWPSGASGDIISMIRLADPALRPRRRPRR